MNTKLLISECGHSRKTSSSVLVGTEKVSGRICWQRRRLYGGNGGWGGGGEITDDDFCWNDGHNITNITVTEKRHPCLFVFSSEV